MTAFDTLPNVPESLIQDIEVADKVFEVYSAYEIPKAQFSLNVDHASDLAAQTTRLVAAISAVNVPEGLSIREVRTNGVRDAENPSATTADEDPSSLDGPATT